MPLHLICECCKCKESLSQDLWAISRNHKYAESRYLCEHFDVEIDHVSKTGFFGIGWSNEITVRARYKPTGTKKNVISRTFSKNSMEYQNYIKFNKVVIHARISDYRDNYPTIGYSVQDDIEYNEERERQRQEKLRLQRQRREEMRRQEEMQRQEELRLERQRREEMQR